MTYKTMLNERNVENSIKGVSELLQNSKVPWSSIEILLLSIPQIHRKNWGPIHPKSTETEMTTNPMKIAVLDHRNEDMLAFFVKFGVYIDTMWQGVCRTFGGQRTEIRALTGLSCAIAQNNFKLVTKFVHFGADINMKIPCYSYFNGNWHEYFTTPLLTAIELSTFEMVDTLLNFGAKSELRVQTAAGGQLDAETLAEQRQDLSIIQTLQNQNKKLLSLKELSRFSIRSHLKNPCPHLLQNVCLPKTLINYLCFN